MNCKRIGRYVLLLFMTLQTPLTAQVCLSSISVMAGSMGTINAHEREYAFYPEITVGGPIYASYLTWETYWGFWDDGIEREYMRDGWSYSHSGHILGARVGFSPQKAAEHWLIPLDLFAGVAHHFVKSKNLGGSDWDGRTGSDRQEKVTTAEIGLSARIALIGPVGIKGKVHKFFPLGNRKIDREQKGRRAFTLGVSLEF